MLINADFSCRVEVSPDDYEWVASPQAGVERVMLDRVGAEKARATSIVRYAPDSSFPYHRHPDGEEILVLSGTFSDESGDYPDGTYLRNPPGSGHAPFSLEGAIIFVKLRQMRSSETRQISIDTQQPARWMFQGDRATQALFSDDSEQVSMLKLNAGSMLFKTPVDGAEVLVLQGKLHEGSREYSDGSWLRLPAGHYPDFIAGATGVTLYLKTGHLSSSYGSKDPA